MDSFLGRYIQKNKDYFGNLQVELKRANLKYLLEDYLNLILNVGVAIFAVSALLLIAAMALTGAPIPLIVPLAILLGACFAVITFIGFLAYPSFRAKQIDKQIAMNLPFATIYMATVAGAGIPPHTMFKLLSKFKEYGIVAREADIISTETEMFGKDIRSALKRAADRTPNEDFKELLWGMNTIISSGGDLRKFLKATSRKLMSEFNMKIEKFGKQVSMFLELYLTLVVVGSIFFLVLTTILGAMGGMPPIVHIMERVVVYIMVPFISLVFIMVIKSISPT